MGRVNARQATQDSTVSLVSMIPIIYQVSHTQPCIRAFLYLGEKAEINMNTSKINVVFKDMKILIFSKIKMKSQIYKYTEN